MWCEREHEWLNLQLLRLYGASHPVIAGIDSSNHMWVKSQLDMSTMADKKEKLRWLFKTYTLRKKKHFWSFELSD